MELVAVVEVVVGLEVVGQTLGLAVEAPFHLVVVDLVAQQERQEQAQERFVLASLTGQGSHLKTATLGL